MATKVTTVIVNQTKYVLIINVGTHCLASLKAGGDYKIQVDVNWTFQPFQEFVLEVDNTDLNTLTEVDGNLDALREPQQQSADANSSSGGGGYLKMGSKLEWHAQLAGKVKLEYVAMGEEV